MPVYHSGNDPGVMAEIGPDDAGQVQDDVAVDNVLYQRVDRSRQILPGLEHGCVFEGKDETRQGHEEDGAIDDEIAALDQEEVLDFAALLHRNRFESKNGLQAAGQSFAGRLHCFDNDPHPHKKTKNVPKPGMERPEAIVNLMADELPAKEGGGQANDEEGSGQDDKKAPMPDTDGEAVALTKIQGNVKVQVDRFKPARYHFSPIGPVS